MVSQVPGSRMMNIEHTEVKRRKRKQGAVNIIALQDEDLTS